MVTGENRIVKWKKNEFKWKKIQLESPEREIFTLDFCSITNSKITFFVFKTFSTLHFPVSEKLVTFVVVREKLFLNRFSQMIKRTRELLPKCSPETDQFCLGWRRGGSRDQGSQTQKRSPNWWGLKRKKRWTEKRKDQEQFVPI